MRDRLKHTMLVPVVALALVGFVGCEGAEVAEEPEEVAGSPASDIGPMEAAIEIDDVTLGGELSPDGSIATGHTDDEFAPGQPLYVAMEVGDATAGSEVRVAWFDPDGTERHVDRKTIEIDQHYMSFQGPDTSDWPLGTYRGEVWYGDQMVNEFEFQITTPEEADPLAT